MAKRPVKIRGRPNAASPKKVVGIKKRQFPKSNPKLQDARQKLIQKKRSKVVDARDVLANIAKTQDARTKINKIRQKRSGIANPNGNIKVIGSNILQKTDRNGKISLVTNKSKTTGVNAAIQKELGLMTTPKKATVVKRQMAAPRIPQNIRQAVLNELDQAAYNQVVVRNFDHGSYKWSRPGLRTTASQIIGSLENRPRFAKGDSFQGWQNFPVSKAIRPATYVDLDAMDDEEMPMVPMKQTISLQGSSRISNIHSRLDGSPMRDPETHGILSKTKTKVVVPAGHRIVVSNLQSTVTQDDVKELFEDIGLLLAARLVRPGVAEVIYKTLKDAQKAVETYHNRQLDGQPMKCMLVNKRPYNNPTAPPLSKMESQGYVFGRS